MERITLTNDHYRTLLRAVELAMSVTGPLADSISDAGPDYNPIHRKFDELQKHLLNFTDKFDAKDFVEISEGKRYLADKITDEMIDIVLDYEEMTFWTQLSEELARRDIQASLVRGDEKVVKNFFNDRFQIEYELESYYEQEFDKYGVDRLLIDKNLTAIPPVPEKYFSDNLEKIGAVDDKETDLGLSLVTGGDSHLDDGCPICLAQRKADAEHRPITEAELLEAFKQADNKKNIVSKEKKK